MTTHPAVHCPECGAITRRETEDDGTMVLHRFAFVGRERTAAKMRGQSSLAQTSDPTYRIDVKHDPSGPVDFTWTAEVYRLSDGSLVAVKTGPSRDDVGERAITAVYQLTHEQQEPFTVFVDDDGRPVEGHSVKA